MGKKYKDRSQYPVALDLVEHDLKLHMTLSADGDMFDLIVNNMTDFFALPYKYELER